MGMPGTVSVAAAIVASAVLAGCSAQADIAPSPATSSSTTAATSSGAPRTAAPTAPAAPAAGEPYTLDHYFRDNGINETTIKPPTPGAPQVSLPVPPGWTNLDADAPHEAFWMIALVPAPSSPAPVIAAAMSKLDGPADQAKIIEFAPNSLRTSPGYQGPETGTVAKFSGFDAVQIAGTSEHDGVKLFVASTVVVIPGTDGLYLLQFKSLGSAEQQDALTQAMSVVDEQTRITV